MRIKRIFFVLSVLVMILSGCMNETEVSDVYSQKLDRLTEDYIEENSIEHIHSELNGDDNVIFYKTETGYGMAVLFLENETEEMIVHTAQLRKCDDAHKLTYTQIDGKSAYYIGIMIDDVELSKAAKSIFIRFEDSSGDQPYAIQQTISGKRELVTQVISYESHEKRNISSIRLLNDNSQSIFEIE